MFDDDELREVEAQFNKESLEADLDAELRGRGF